MQRQRDPAHRGTVLAASALVLSGLVLRLSVASVPPVLDDIRSDEGLSLVAAGILVTTPVICYGIGAWVTPRLASRGRLEVLLAEGVAASAVGMAVRAVPGVVPLFVGTVVAGAGAATAGVVAPSIIKREYGRPGLMMGLFTLALSISAVIAAALTVPLSEALGSWRLGLILWSVPAAFAFLVVAVAMGDRRHREMRTARPYPERPPWHVKRAWHLAVFMGAQVTLFYSCLNWLPLLFRDHGMSPTAGGVLLSVMLAVGLPTSLVIPVIAARTQDQRLVTAGSTACWIIGLAGLAVAPAFVPLVWMAIIGAGQGAGVGLALTFPVLRASHEQDAAVLGGMAQGIGYVAGAAGAFLTGLVHDVTGTWTTPFVMLVGVACVLLCAGLGAARPGHIVAVPVASR